MYKNILISILFFSLIGLFYKDVLSSKLYLHNYGEEYKELMFQCDHAMREHLIAKQTVKYDASSISVKNLQSAENALIACHDYDKLRKVMNMNGVSNEMLSYLGLQAIEEKEYELQEFIRIHEFKFN